MGTRQPGIATVALASAIALAYPGQTLADIVSADFIASAMDEDGCRLDLSTWDHGDDGCLPGDGVSGYWRHCEPGAPWWECDHTCTVVESGLLWEYLDSGCFHDDFGTYHCHWSGFAELEIPCEVLSFEQICSGSCCGWLSNATALDIDFEQACNRGAFQPADPDSEAAGCGCSIPAVRGTEAGIAACLAVVFLISSIAARRIGRAAR